MIWWRRARISNCKATRVRKEEQRTIKAETNRLNIGMRAYQRNRANIKSFNGHEVLGDHAAGVIVWLDLKELRIQLLVLKTL